MPLQRTMVFSPATEPNFHLPLPPGDAIIQVHPERDRPKVKVRYVNGINSNNRRYRCRNIDGL